MALIPSHSLQEQGWTQCFTAMGLRLKGSIELCWQLGYEVPLEPANLTEEQREAEVALLKKEVTCERIHLSLRRTSHPSRSDC